MVPTMVQHEVTYSISTPNGWDALESKLLAQEEIVLVQDEQTRVFSSPESGVFVLPLDGMLVHCMVTPQH